MKKVVIIFSIAIALAFVGNKVYNKSELSSIYISNIEALSADENGSGGSSQSWSCWSSVKKGDGCYVCGNPCEFYDNKAPKDGEGTCYK